MCICVCVCGGGEKAQKVPPAPTCGVAQVLHDVGGSFYVAHRGREGVCSTTTAHQKSQENGSLAPRRKGWWLMMTMTLMIQDHASGLLLESKKLTYDTRKARLDSAVPRSKGLRGYGL